MYWSKPRHSRANLHPFEQLVDLLIRHFLSELCQDVAQFPSPDEPVTFLVEYLETTDELLYE